MASSHRRAAAVASSRMKQEEPEESEWEQEEQEADSSEDEDFSAVEEDDEEEMEVDDADEEYVDRDNEFLEVKKESKMKKKSTLSASSRALERQRSSRKREKNRPDLVSSGDENEGPTHARRTVKGGYAHTKKSKSRISRANRGKIPWNKGRTRSEADKARIRAGVQARNRTKLLKKLKKLGTGLTEEDYIQKRKQIKYLRERLRRAKLPNSKHPKNAKTKGTRGRKTDDEEDVGTETAAEATKNSSAESDDEGRSEEQMETTYDDHQEDDEISAKTDVGALSMFSSDIEWTSHDFDSGQVGAYKERCPIDGPGGLICCDSCLVSYSQYMTQTTRDMESQRIDNVGNEINEILGFVKETQTSLKQNIRAARRQPPPPKARPMSTVASSSKVRAAGISSPIEWGATSTFNIRGMGPTTLV